MISALHKREENISLLSTEENGKKFVNCFDKTQELTRRISLRKSRKSIGKTQLSLGWQS